MADSANIINTMVANGAFRRVATNPLAQFGPANRPYLGADLMPERVVLKGQATTYYIKQLAQHGVRDLLPQVRLENAITVEN